MAVVTVGFLAGMVACSETVVKPRARSYCTAARDIIESLIVTDGTSVRISQDRGCAIDNGDGSEQYVGMMDITAEELAASLARVDVLEVPADDGYVRLSTAPFEYVVEVGACRLVLIVALDDSRPPSLNGPNLAFIMVLRDGLRAGTIRCSRDE